MASVQDRRDGHACLAFTGSVATPGSTRSGRARRNAVTAPRTGMKATRTLAINHGFPLCGTRSARLLCVRRGALALSIVGNILDSRRGEIDSWRELSASTDHAD